MGVMWLKKHTVIKLRLKIMKSKIDNSYIVKKLVKFTLKMDVKETRRFIKPR
jgi:hypothetical protein